MRTFHPAVVALLLCLGAAPAVASESPAVRVAFVDAALHGDVAGRPDGDRVRAAYLDALREHIVARAAPRLAQGQALAVEITGLISPGTIESSRRTAGSDPRVLRDVAPARIDLRFRLVAADGSLVRGGERSLRDPTLFGSPALNPTDPLRYEKALIDEWIDRELPVARG